MLYITYLVLIYLITVYLLIFFLPFLLPPTLVTTSLISMNLVVFCLFLFLFCFVLFWDSTYKWSDMLFVFLWLISLSITSSRSTNLICQIFPCNQFRFPDIFWTREYIKLTLSSCGCSVGPGTWFRISPHCVSESTVVPFWLLKVQELELSVPKSLWEIKRVVEPLELMKLGNYLSSYYASKLGGKKMFMESTLGGV